jgi:hypothetical protein
MHRMFAAFGVALGLAIGIYGCEGIGGGGCCKECTNSKPCGDSCIAVSQTCNKGSGCACRVLDDGRVEPPLASEADDTGTTTAATSN